MNKQLFFLLAAEGVLLLHVLFVAFVVVGLLLILVGRVRTWRWVSNPWFRLVHLIAIGGVVIQAWLERICPLTDLEMALRARAGEAVYAESFIAHWLETILYYQAPAWVFVAVYTAFGIVVALSWRLVPPRSFKKHRPR